MKKFTFGFIACMMAISPSIMAASADTRSIDDLILDVEGEAKYYTQTAKCWISSVVEELEVKNAEIVFGEDGKVYFWDILAAEMESYVMGTLEGDKITIELPQLIISNASYNCSLMLLDEAEVPADWAGILDSWYTVSPEKNPKVTFTVSSDGVITMDPLENQIIGSVATAPIYLTECGWGIFSTTYVPNSPTGIADNVADQELKDVRYYDINGRVVGNANTPGVYVRVKQYENGSTVSDKVIIK